MKRLKLKIAATPKLRSVLTICGLLVITFAGMCIYSDSYRSVYNITNLLAQCVPLACVALGQTLVIISGGIDLSVGPLISVCTVAAAKLMNTDNPLQIALGAAAVLGIGFLVGALNGCGIHDLKVPPLIATLCMSTVLNGIALWIMPMAGGKINKSFAKFIFQKWDILSMPLLILAVSYLIVHRILYHTRTGVGIYAIGKDRKIAASMGVRIRSVSIRAYVLSGLCAAITGLLLACRMRVGDPTCGSVYSMDSITAAAIGGTSMAGGAGLISGTIAGAFLVGMLSNLMNILEINQFYQYVLKGGLLIAAMIIYSISDLLEVRHRAKQ